MEGIQIEKSSGNLAASLSAMAAAVSVALAVWMGPRGTYAASGAGAALAALGFFFAARRPGPEKPFGFPAVMLFVHALLLGVGFYLQARFLDPLPKDMAKMPRLQRAYDDPAGMFALRGPAGWTYRAAPSRLESGVRLQPAAAGSYMGVSEVAVFVSRLEVVPASPEAFLEKAASNFSEKESKRRLFSQKMERGKSLTGAPVIWSTITMKKFWLSLYQVSIFGVKDGRYLCSVSATGLTAHNTLARLVCLGLFERIVVTDQEHR